MYTLLFDLDDTLYDLAAPFKKTYLDFASRRYPIDPDRLFLSSRKYSDEVFEKSRKGQITMEEMYIYRIKKSFGDFNINVSDSWALEFQKRYALNQKKIRISDTIEKLLKKCMAAGIQMGIITNGPSEHQWRKVKSLQIGQWIPKEHIFVSADIGYAKPDVRIFKHVQNKLKFDSSNAYYIGDSFALDVIGANSAGFHTVWFNRRNKTVDNPVKPGHIVTTEQELYELVKDLFF